MKAKRSKSRRGPEKEPAYLEFIAGHRCVACIAWDASQSTPTEVAHCGARGIGQKCSDLETLPLCEKHHRTGRLAHHVLGKKFWSYHGMDRDKLIAEYRGAYESQRAMTEKLDDLDDVANPKMMPLKAGIRLGRKLLNDPDWMGGGAVCRRSQNICENMDGSACKACGFPVSWHKDSL